MNIKMLNRPSNPNLDKFLGQLRHILTAVGWVIIAASGILNIVISPEDIQEGINLIEVLVGAGVAVFSHFWSLFAKNPEVSTETESEGA